MIQNAGNKGILGYSFGDSVPGCMRRFWGPIKRDFMSNKPSLSGSYTNSLPKELLTQIAKYLVPENCYTKPENRGFFLISKGFSKCEKYVIKENPKAIGDILLRSMKNGQIHPYFKKIFQDIGKDVKAIDFPFNDLSPNTPADCAALFQRFRFLFPNVCEITLRCKVVDSHLLESIHFPKCRTLAIHGAKKIVLGSLEQYKKTLKRLSLQNCTLSDSEMQIIAQSRCRKLDLINCKNVTYNNLQLLHVKNSKLRHLSITHVYKSEVAFQFLKERMPKLRIEEVNLGRIHKYCHMVMDGMRDFREFLGEHPRAVVLGGALLSLAALGFTCYNVSSQVLMQMDQIAIISSEAAKLFPPEEITPQLISSLFSSVQEMKSLSLSECLLKHEPSKILRNLCEALARASCYTQ